MSDHVVEPLRDVDALRDYIDARWQRGHVLARDPRMLAFQYATPWVDREVFPGGHSVLGAYAPDGHLAGFLGTIAAPYPRPRSYWIALWHVLPELKGTGVGGRLLGRMQEIAMAADGWLGTFGAGPEALPVYLNRGYTARGVRRWLYVPGAEGDAPGAFGANPGPREVAPPPQWLDYRYDAHPVFAYERDAAAVLRTEDNDWGRVTHVLRLDGEGEAEVRVAAVHARERAIAAAAGREFLLDAWAFEAPGEHWRPAPRELPSVFHPPEARGNLIFAVGFPFLPGSVQKGDCDMDRPN